ncbi:MAG: cytochrome c maturation protein CcmE [Gammaproteobacteria bacterium]|nr:cytochrome c maturation protein CcmE [Gammaproteobacteria bacterium]
MKAREKRLVMVLVGMTVLGLSGWLVFNALGNNLSYFFSPSEIAEGKAPQDHVFRLGGLVVPNSLQRGEGVDVHFVVTDNAKSIDVLYSGILPDLFMEGQGVIAQGKIRADGTFVADEVLAKHDENYMPPEVADALEQAHQKGVTGAAN